jgi:L-cysteine:1D-myo-inositol 2-amino-2-deoxy-alpha-D-glucopyranoside ligase
MSKWPEIYLSPLNLSLPTMHLMDSNKGLTQVKKSRFFSMYVCGITPYDATHLGHAATYLSFDLINRYLNAQHVNVDFAENITDIDDPLLERAKRDNVEWKSLAESQVALFTDDMCALRVIPPRNFVKVTDSMSLIEAFIKKLEANDYVYKLENDLYFAAESYLADLPMGIEEALATFAERGGDPKRVGKRHPLDPILWIGHKDNEPGWESSFGFGRPGWHVECTAIALHYLDRDEDEFVIDLQGGGSDLIFPHHYMSAQLIKAATGREFAKLYVHTGMIGLAGEKMSKSKGNLVFVSKLLADGTDPVVIRWALFTKHYQSYREWTQDLLDKSQEEVAIIRAALAKSEVIPAEFVLNEIAKALANNLDTPTATRLIIEWAKRSLDNQPLDELSNDSGEMARGLDTLLGLAF